MQRPEVAECGRRAPNLEMLNARTRQLLEPRRQSGNLPCSPEPSFCIEPTSGKIDSDAVPPLGHCRPDQDN